MLEVREGEKLTSCLLLLTSVINLISSGEINIKIMMPKMRYLGKTADRREIKIKPGKLALNTNAANSVHFSVANHFSSKSYSYQPCYFTEVAIEELH